MQSCTLKALFLFHKRCFYTLILDKAVHLMFRDLSLLLNSTAHFVAFLIEIDIGQYGHINVCI